MKLMKIYRGLPGSGKSTLAEKDAEQGGIVCSSDNFMVNTNGKYSFNPRRLTETHRACRTLAEQSCKEGRPLVVVDNTNTQAWEYAPYLQIAKEHGYRVEIIDLYDGGCTNEELRNRGRHGAPIEAIQRMRQRYTHS